MAGQSPLSLSAAIEKARQAHAAYERNPSGDTWDSRAAALRDLEQVQRREPCTTH